MSTELLQSIDTMSVVVVNLNFEVKQAGNGALRHEPDMPARHGFPCRSGAESLRFESSCLRPAVNLPPLSRVDVDEHRRNLWTK